MTDEPTNKTATWKVNEQPFIEDFEGYGFLQLCADRRFHALIQKEFKDDAGLSEREDYWIHADAGGTPKMVGSLTAPEYCYGKKNVRLMGWSAHGDVCGGFGDNVPDHVIQDALCKSMQINVPRYPEATHFIYFVTVKDGSTLISRMIILPGEVFVCE